MDSETRVLRQSRKLPPDQREGLTVDEAAALMGIGRNTAYEAIRSGAIPSIRVGGRIIVPKAALRRKLEAA